jgi:hypothetical protein
MWRPRDREGSEEMVNRFFLNPSSSAPVSVSEPCHSQAQAQAEAPAQRGPANCIELTASERSYLEALVRDGNSPARERRRARLVLLAAEGHDDGEVSRRVGCSAATVRIWRRRFSKGRLGALPDATHHCGGGGLAHARRAVA